MNIDRLREMLIQHEGIRYKPYTDMVGKLTIGVGRNLTDLGIDRSEVEFLLDNDIKRTLGNLQARLPWYKTLSEDQQLVIADMCFNLGLQGLLGFKDFLGWLKEGDYQNARAAMLNSKWALQVGQRALELAQLIYPSSDSEIKDA